MEKDRDADVKKMEAALSIDEIYAEIRNYDIVLCNDAPLATALNNRADRAVLGRLVLTPRQLAAKVSAEVMGMPLIDDITLARKVSEETGYSLKYVHGEIENYKKAYKYSSDFTGRLSRRSKKVFESYSQYNTLEKVMNGFHVHSDEYFAGKKVAVIGVDLFDNLDKNMCPLDSDIIEISDPDRTYSIDSMYVLGNDRTIAECAADIAERCGPNDVAIVVDTSGPITDAVRSVLYQNRIPFINSLEVKDLGSIRNFLEFIHLALSFETVQVREARNLVTAYGGFIRSKYDRYYLSKYWKLTREDTKTYAILARMADVRSFTFREILADCVPSADRSSVTMLLDQMDCADSYVDRAVLDDLVYAVNSIASLKHNEQIDDNDRKGVLLVDCRNSVYIDRPVIIYTGLGSDWEADLSCLDYIDPKKRPDIEDVNVLRFRTLLQQGSVRYYLANATKGGKEALPCKYFDKCMSPGDEENGFAAICTSEPIRFPWKTHRRDRSEGIDYSSFPGCPEGCPKTFSNSSYMEYLICPRGFMYSRLTESEDSSSTYIGSRIHDFAEFRAAYPDYVDRYGLDYYLDLIAEDCATLNSPDLSEVERSRYYAQICAIDMFLDYLGTEPGTMVPRDSEDTNELFLHHGLTETSEHSEREFRSVDSLMKGRIDLLWNGIIYDFKTGKPKKASEIMHQSEIFEMSSERPDSENRYKSCQALFYLCLLQDCGIENERIFRLFYAQQAYNQQLSGGTMPDSGQCVRTVMLCENEEEALSPGGPLRDIFGTTKYSVLDPLQVYSTCSRIAGRDMNAWKDGNDARDDLVDAVCRESCGGKKILAKDREYAKSAIKCLHREMTGGFASLGNTVTVMRWAVDRFREKLTQDFEEMKRSYDARFECAPTIECRDCQYRSLCTDEVMTGGQCDVSE